MLFVALAAMHGVVLAMVPTVPVIAAGIWWNSNTIAHNFIHRPFFKTAAANLMFSAYLSVLLGIPQSLWRDRHLAHHRHSPWHLRCSAQLCAEAVLVGIAWTALVITQPAFFVTTYLPAFGLGLCLCAMQGHYEHARGTTSHYGRLYNALCFNDGYHVEHHANPGAPWTRLRDLRARDARTSRWPPLLRWLDSVEQGFKSVAQGFSLVSGLEALERLVLRHDCLQRFVLRSHRRAFAALLPTLPAVRRVAIVGGGLFPRTALILRDLLPDARIVLVDASEDNLATASSFLGARPMESECRLYSLPDTASSEFDLVIIPLSFQGDRRAIYRRPPSSAVLVHDWIWRRRGKGRVVSIALLKRLNLIQQSKGQ
jgi:hypothetical protein